MTKLRFALLGCGRIAKKHIEAISSLEEAELAAVCDTNSERAKRIGEKLNIPFFTSYDEMLTKVPVDVVNILTPSGLHAEHAVEIARKYKKHIVCEKPMALTLSDADQMIEACRENDVRLFVVKQNRYNLPVMKLKEAVEAGRFGKMALGTVRVRWKRDQAYYDQDGWRGTWEMDGGVFSNQASHHIDLLEWMMGEPEEVSAMTATRLVNIEAEDVGVATIRFKNGALGIIEATTAARPKDIEGSISVLGEKGMAEIGGFAVNEVKLWQFSESWPEDAEILSKFRENPPNVYGFGHARYLQNVVDCLKKGGKASVDGQEGRRSLKLIVALYQSAETGKKVRIEGMSDTCRLGRRRG